jgi:oligopeptide transport system ATP-binding protein
MAERLLDVQDLKTYFRTRAGDVRAVDGVDLTVREGETVGLVGESGSGKSVTARSIMRLVPTPPGRYVGGRILFRGRDLLTLPEHEMRQIRGGRISMIFQDPMTFLNPVFTAGDQVAEAIRLHQGASKDAAREETIRLFRLVGIPNPEGRYDAYPHHLSGGLRQRVMIAIALSSKPDLLIADEPTTALDVTIQAQILDLLRELQAKMRLALLLITHDLGVVAEMADRVAVMYAGRIVEDATVDQLFGDPKHPYTRGLMASIPGGAPGARLTAIQGTVPALGQLPPGCAFAPRCPDRFEPCTSIAPQSTDLGPNRAVKCHLWGSDPRQLVDASRKRSGSDPTANDLKPVSDVNPAGGGV